MEEIDEKHKSEERNLIDLQILRYQLNRTQDDNRGSRLLIGGMDGLWSWTRLEPQGAKQMFALSQSTPGPSLAELEVAQATVPMWINQAALFSRRDRYAGIDQIKGVCG